MFAAFHKSHKAVALLVRRAAYGHRVKEITSVGNRLYHKSVVVGTVYHKPIVLIGIFIKRKTPFCETVIVFKLSESQVMAIGELESPGVVSGIEDLPGVFLIFEKTADPVIGELSNGLGRTIPEYKGIGGAIV